ncbi:hypothetical protein GGX14DRAFT_387529 [Mycena pura]|uniref:Uncharacterized protein n=1 Tax=Mycena pura TaxID=153505 RepID=A0AAD6YM06_9AGAR|nr:hypothetical protein GGX14DRAFT_387529 [Mycena pura]
MSFSGNLTLPSPPPSMGSVCPECEIGTILYNAQCSGRGAVENKGKYFVKCSRNFSPSMSSPWLTDLAMDTKCYAFWWVAGQTYHCLTSASCHGNGKRNTLCTHWLCQDCCAKKAAIYAEHVCKLVGHRNAFHQTSSSHQSIQSPQPGQMLNQTSMSPLPDGMATPGSHRSLASQYNTPTSQFNPDSHTMQLGAVQAPFPGQMSTTPSHQQYSSPSNTPTSRSNTETMFTSQPNTPVSTIFQPSGSHNIAQSPSTVVAQSPSTVKSTFQMHGHNVSEYFLRSLPERFLEHSLTNDTSPISTRKTTRNQLAEEARNQVREVNGPVTFFSTSAPHFPWFHPSTSGPIQRFSGLTADELKCFCVLLPEGLWDGRDTATSLLNVGSHGTILGSFDFAGQRRKAAEVSDSHIDPSMSGKRRQSLEETPAKRIKQEPNIETGSRALVHEVIEISSDEEVQDVFGPVHHISVTGYQSHQKPVAAETPTRKSAVVFPGQYTVDVIHQFEKVISKSKSMSVLRAAEEVYGRKVASTSWYSHYNVWRLGKDNPEIQKMISTSVAAGRTEAGLWEAIPQDILCQLTLQQLQTLAAERENAPRQRSRSVSALVLANQLAGCHWEYSQIELPRPRNVQRREHEYIIDALIQTGRLTVPVLSSASEEEILPVNPQTLVVDQENRNHEHRQVDLCKDSGEDSSAETAVHGNRDVLTPLIHSVGLPEQEPGPVDMQDNLNSVAGGEIQVLPGAEGDPTETVQAQISPVQFVFTLCDKDTEFQRGFSATVILPLSSRLPEDTESVIVPFGMVLIAFAKVEDERWVSSHDTVKMHIHSPEVIPTSVYPLIQGYLDRCGESCTNNCTGPRSEKHFLPIASVNLEGLQVAGRKHTWWLTNDTTFKAQRKQPELTFVLELFIARNVAHTHRKKRKRNASPTRSFAVNNRVAGKEVILQVYGEDQTFLDICASRAPNSDVKYPLKTVVQWAVFMYTAVNAVKASNGKKYKFSIWKEAIGYQTDWLSSLYYSGKAIVKGRHGLEMFLQFEMESLQRRVPSSTNHDPLKVNVSPQKLKKALKEMHPSLFDKNKESDDSVDSDV